MTEADRTQLLSRVFDVIRKRAAELRKTGDFYDGAYSADELVRLPRYIAPRLDAGLASDAVVITREEFDTLWNGLRWRDAQGPDFDWLDRLKGRVDGQQIEDEE